MSGSRPLRFYFDYLSPYAYLAWTQLPALATRHGRSIEPVPILLAALLGAHGQKGPAEIPSKRVYVFKDTTRSAHHLGVPFGPPPSHPFNPLLALRVSSMPMTPEQRTRLVDGLFAAVWGGSGPGVTDPEVVAGIARDAGLDGAALVAAAATEEAKSRLKAQTDAALAEGTFGVPTIIADGEIFWGLDAFPHLERRLSGEDPIDRLDLARYRDLPASASRRAPAK